MSELSALQEILIGAERLLTKPKSKQQLHLASGMLLSARALLTTLEEWQSWGRTVTNLLYLLGSYVEEDPYG